MDERRQSTAVERPREASPSRGLAEQREQIKRYLTELGETADAAEREIAESIRSLLADVAVNRESPNSKRESARLAECAKQLDDRENELDARERDLETRESELNDRLQQLAVDTAQLAESRRQAEQEAEEGARRLARSEERLRRLDEREAEIEAEQQRTKTQRRRIAAELKEQRDAAQRERRTALEEIETATADLHRRDEELQRLNQELQRRNEELQHRAAELDRRESETTASTVVASDDSPWREQIASLEAALDERNAALEEVASDVEDLRTRLGDYKAKLADAEARLNAADIRADEADDDGEWRSRYEEAAENLRDLKQHCAALEKAAAASAKSAGGGELAMDWESQKRRLLQSLENNADPDDPDAEADRLTIDGTIRITDNVIAQRDRRIAELEAELATRSTAPAADYTDLLSQDEFIARHRTEIAKLKDEWTATARAAEIELSLERAKLARERMSLDERFAELESQARQAKDRPTPTAPATDAAKKAGGGRWLARLGLREQDE